MSPQPTILIVDDEKHTRDGLRRLLENDYDVYVAPDLGGAMNVLEREQIDVLLTDLRLGGEDGMQGSGMNARMHFDSSAILREQLTGFRNVFQRILPVEFTCKNFVYIGRKTSF